MLGYPAAWILANKNLNRSAVTIVLFIMPMWINALMRTLATAELFHMLGVQLGKGTLIVGMVYDYLPYMVLPLYSIMAKMDVKLIEAARDLGCNSFGVLRRVIWPLSLPGVINGVTMVLIPSVSTFYISQKLGDGKFFLIGDAIESQYVANNLHFAAAMAFILMVVLLVCMGVMQVLTNRHVEGGN